MPNVKLRTEEQDEMLLRIADKLVGEGLYDKVGPVPRHKFDMEFLFCERRGSETYISFEDFNSEQCNTAACAMGWAMSDLWFKKKGFATYSTWENKLGLDLDSGSFIHSETEYLFESSSYSAGRNVAPSIVARRIRRFVKRGGLPRSWKERT